VCFLHFISILGDFVVKKERKKERKKENATTIWRIEFETLYHHHTYKQNMKVKRISALCGYSQQLTLSYMGLFSCIECDKR